MSQKKTLNRRYFIDAILATGTVAGLITQVNANPKPGGNKIKMLTSVEKLVEVDQSVIEKITSSQKASDKEVFDWTDQKQKYHLIYNNHKISSRTELLMV